MARKHIISENVSYPVMETFYSIQGEGYHQGKAACFIRLGGCNVGCHWCDVKESWPADVHPKLSVEEIVKGVLSYKSKTVIVTGGEPLMYDLGPLTKALKGEGLQTHIETSGAYPLSGEWDWICLSPKKFMPAIDEVFSQADELKMIIFNQSDFKFAEESKKKSQSFIPQVPNSGHRVPKLYMQPEWDRSSIMLPAIIDYVKNHPEWEISLQIHKFMDIS